MLRMGTMPQNGVLCALGLWVIVNRYAVPQDWACKLAICSSDYWVAIACLVVCQRESWLSLPLLGLLRCHHSSSSSVIHVSCSGYSAIGLICCLIISFLSLKLSHFLPRSPHSLRDPHSPWTSHSLLDHWFRIVNFVVIVIAFAHKVIHYPLVGIFLIWPLQRLQPWVSLDWTDFAISIKSGPELGY